MLIGGAAALHLDVGAGEWAAREAIARGDEDGGFALLDALLGDRSPTVAPPLPLPTPAAPPAEPTPAATPERRR